MPDAFFDDLLQLQLLDVLHVPLYTREEQ